MNKKQYWSMLVLAIVGCLLLCSPAQAEEKRKNYGEAWNFFNDTERLAYLWGLSDGFREGNTEHNRFLSTLQINWELYKREISQYIFFESLATHFPDLQVVRDVMTKFYADPSNTYIRFPTIFLISVAEIRGSSPEIIGKLLGTARKDAYSDKFASQSFRDMVDKEIYPERKAK